MSNEPMSAGPKISGWSVLGGFVLGLFLAIAIVMADAFLISLIRVPAHGISRAVAWIPFAVNAGIMIAIGVAAIRRFDTSGVARGIVIAMALLFLLNGICGVAMSGSFFH